MIADILLLLTGLIALTIAAYNDIKTTEIPDWLSFSLIFTGIAIRLMHSSIYSKWDYFAYGLLGLALMSVLGNIMYYSRQWGGGDAKIAMGLGVIFGTTPSFLDTGIPFLLVIFINIIFFGALYGLAWSVYLALKHKAKLKKELAMSSKNPSI